MDPDCKGWSISNELLGDALARPGAILICRDTRGFRDPANVGYEIGVQQPRQHVRFANIFYYGTDVAVYVRHDPARIAELYEACPKFVFPSEIAPRFWSKVFITDASSQAIATQLLDASYGLVLARLTKQGREALKRMASEANTFHRFHDLALEFESSMRGALVFYSNTPDTPEIRFQGVTIARFAWNSLQVRARSSAEWLTLGADRIEFWRQALFQAAS